MRKTPAPGRVERPDMEEALLAVQASPAKREQG
jgi:hypothetical protein